MLLKVTLMCIVNHASCHISTPTVCSARVSYYGMLARVIAISFCFVYLISEYRLVSELTKHAVREDSQLALILSPNFLVLTQPPFILELT